MADRTENRIPKEWSYTRKHPRKSRDPIIVRSDATRGNRVTYFLLPPELLGLYAR